MVFEFHIVCCLDFLQNTNAYENGWIRYVEQCIPEHFQCKIPLFKVFDKRNG